MNFGKIFGGGRNEKPAPVTETAEKNVSEASQELIEKIEGGNLNILDLGEFAKNSDSKVAEKAKAALINKLNGGAYTHDDAKKLMDHPDNDIAQAAKFYCGYA